jgi:FMN reductase
METRTLTVISAGLSQPSSTRMLADKLAAATLARREGEYAVDVVTVELKDFAHDIVNNMLTGFPSPKLEEVIASVETSDGLIAVTPIFTTSYSGLFKSFFDIVDNKALADLPVLIGATAGTPRHSLALDYAIRPVFNYLHAVVVPTGVFAATGDWGDSGDKVRSLPERIDRGAGELAELMKASERSHTVRDPFALDTSLSPVGGFQPS